MERLQIRYTIEQADVIAEALYVQAQASDVPEDAVLLEVESARLRNLAARARARAARAGTG